MATKPPAGIRLTREYAPDPPSDDDRERQIAALLVVLGPRVPGARKASSANRARGSQACDSRGESPLSTTAREQAEVSPWSAPDRRLEAVTAEQSQAEPGQDSTNAGRPPREGSVTSIPRATAADFPTCPARTTACPSGVGPGATFARNGKAPDRL